MKSIEQWFEQYGDSHQNPLNKKIHKFCVPLITWSIAGLLHSIPTFEVMQFLGISWMHLILSLVIIFYSRFKNIKVLAACVLMFFPIVILFSFVEIPVYFHVLIFVLAWIGQFIGHKIEGKKPSFFNDLKFLLIGPLWVLNDVLKISK